MRAILKQLDEYKGFLGVFQDSISKLYKTLTKRDFENKINKEYLEMAISDANNIINNINNQTLAILNSENYKASQEERYGLTEKEVKDEKKKRYL
jgi:hypothetical protein